MAVVSSKTASEESVRIVRTHQRDQDVFFAARNLWSEVLSVERYKRLRGDPAADVFVMVEENDTGLEFIQPRCIPVLLVVVDPTRDWASFPFDLLRRGQVPRWGGQVLRLPVTHWGVMVLIAAGISFSLFTSARFRWSGAEAADDAGGPQRGGGRGLRDALPDGANPGVPPRIVSRGLKANRLALGLPAESMALHQELSMDHVTVAKLWGKLDEVQKLIDNLVQDGYNIDSGEAVIHSEATNRKLLEIKKILEVDIVEQMLAKFLESGVLGQRIRKSSLGDDQLHCTQDK